MEKNFGFVDSLKRFWRFLKEDTWQSWVVSLVLIVIFIKFIFFPFLSFVTGTSLPLVVVESCSMYHDDSFDDWWAENSGKYSDFGVSKEDFKSFGFDRGLTKGDIIVVWGRGNYEVGDVVIFNAGQQYPIIHRLVSEDPYETLGDNNLGQNSFERNIAEEQIIGKSVARLPLIGWVKLIFFEPFRSLNERGTCGMQG